jgi:hypothetical protein
MRRTVRLTERDLTRLVKRIVREGVVDASIEQVTFADAMLQYGKLPTVITAGRIEGGRLYVTINGTEINIIP